MRNSSIMSLLQKKSLIWYSKFASENYKICGINMPEMRRNSVGIMKLDVIRLVEKEMYF